MKKRKVSKIASLAISLGMIGTLGLSGASKACAHGYVSDPISRSYQGYLLANNGGNWQDLYNKYGEAVNEPQSIEAPKGFPEEGPADGYIASGGRELFHPLDVQTSNTWTHQHLNAGTNLFKWTLTKAHNSERWHYYITKKGWDPNKPLVRSELEKIASFKGKESDTHSTTVIHSIKIPTDRSGYNVILAIWDIGDTPNAFYQVIDVDINNTKVNHSVPSVVSLSTSSHSLL